MMPGRETFLIDCSALLSPMTGIGNYTTSVVNRLLPVPDAPWRMVGWYGGIRRELRCPVACSGARRGWVPYPIARIIKGAARSFGRTFCRNEVRLFWGPNNIIERGIRSQRIALTVHDLSCFKHPEWQPASRVAWFERHFPSSAARADRIITGSAFTAGELQIWGVDPGRITVIPHGIDATVFHPRTAAEQAVLAARLDLPERFVVYVGSVEPRKNLQVVAAAMQRLPATAGKLVLVGDTAWGNAGIDRSIESAGAIRLGRLDGPDLAVLLSRARALVYPSRYEGFGIPPLEALACGCPVLASDIPPVREACDGHARLLPPDDVEAWSAALAEALDAPPDPVARQAGLNHALAFTWDRSAEAHRAVFAALWG